MASNTDLRRRFRSKIRFPKIARSFPVCIRLSRRAKAPCNREIRPQLQFPGKGDYAVDAETRFSAVTWSNLKMPSHSRLHCHPTETSTPGLRSRPPIWCVLGLLLSLLPVSACGQSADAPDSTEPQPQYIRIRKNERKLAVALETSVAHFKDSAKYPDAEVDLIGAIHLGDAQYYKDLNALFPKYDVVLFEAVMPEEAVRQGLRPGTGGGRADVDADVDAESWDDAKIGFAAISVLQLGMKDVLGMEFQLAAVDYSPHNFVHADMTAEEFEATMKKRGESFSQMLLSEMGKSMSSQQKVNPLAMNLDIMLSAVSSDRSWAARRIAASQIVKAGEGTAFAGKDGTSTIITERNLKCLDVLQYQLKKHRRIGIFYGAGHYPDMGQRLQKDFGFRLTGEDWVTAWKLRAPEKTAAPAAVKP
jgi:hypothetical protein